MPNQDSKKGTPKAPPAEKAAPGPAGPPGPKAGAGKKVHRASKPTNPFLERHPPKKTGKR